jgi:putative endonuclease
MFHTYILYSEKLNKYCIGHCEDIVLRIQRHNAGWSHFTSQINDWILKYSEQYPTKSEAMRREHEIKRKKSRKFIEDLITAGGRPD